MMITEYFVISDNKRVRANTILILFLVSAPDTLYKQITITDKTAVIPINRK